MSKMPRLLSSLVIGLLMATALPAGETTAEDAEPATQQVQSVVQRRSTLPTGWFKPVGSRNVAIPEDSQVRPAAHFDATGESDETSKRVKSRLRRVRDAVVYENLETPKRRRTSSNAADATNAAAARVNRKPATATPPSTTQSSRRRSPSRPAPTSVTPTLPTAEATASPSDVTPETTDTQTAESQVRTSEPVRTANANRRSVSAATPVQAENTPSQPEETPVSATPPNAATVEAGSTELPTVATADDEASLPLAPLGDAAPSPRVVSDATSGSESTVSVSSDDVDAETIPEATPSETVSVTNLPSVMRPTVRRSQLNPEPMMLTPIEGDRAASAETQDLDAVPMAELASRPTRESNSDRILIRNESPLISVVTRGPKTLVVGKSATYVFDLKNGGDVGAKDVVVRINIPETVEVVRQHPSVGTAHIHPDDAGRMALAWRVDRLNGNGGEKLHLELIPRNSRPLDLGVTWNFAPEQSSAQIQVKEPKLQLNVVGPQDVLYGETKVYSITISNPGTGDAENVVLHLLPLVPGERQAAIRNLGTVPAGTRKTLEVELTTRQTGRLQVRAEATADGGLHAKSKQEVLVRRGRLAVSVEGPPMKYAGTRARYAVRVRNTGDAPATQVSVVANVPGGATDVASSDGGTLDPNSGQVEWHVGVLRPGASRVFELESKLMSAGDNRVDVRSTAAGDLSALGSTVTTVESLADLKLTVNDPQGAIAVGADVSYEVRVTNRGTKAAQNVQIFGYFSTGIEPVRVAGWRGELNEGEVVLQTIPRLGPGQEMVVKITAQASRPGDHVFRAELECNDPETKLAVEEWTRFYGDDRATSNTARRRPKPAPAKPLKLQRY